MFVVAAQVRATHAAHVVHVREGAFDSFAALTHQAAPARSTNPPTIPVYGRLGLRLLRPFPSPAGRRGDIRADAEGVQFDHDAIKESAARHAMPRSESMPSKYPTSHSRKYCPAGKPGRPITSAENSRH